MVINYVNFYRSQHRTRFFLPAHGARYIIILLISLILYFEMLYCKSQPDSIEGNFCFNRGTRHTIPSSSKKPSNRAIGLVLRQDIYTYVDKYKNHHYHFEQPYNLISSTITEIIPSPE